MKLLKFVGSAVTAFVLGFAGSANADTLQLSMTAGPGACAVSGDTSPLVLVVNTSTACWGATNQFNSEVATGFDFSTPNSPSIDLALNGSYTGSGAYGLTAYFSIVDVDAGGSGVNITLTGSIVNNSPPQGNVSWMICIDDGNTFGGQQQCTPVTPVAGPGGFSQLVLAGTVSGLYSVTIYEFLNPTSPVGVGGPGFSTDANAHAQAPEPGTLALLGIALAGLGFMRYRRQG